VADYDEPPFVAAIDQAEYLDLVAWNDPPVSRGDWANIYFTELQKQLPPEQWRLVRRVYSLAWDSALEFADKEWEAVLHDAPSEWVTVLRGILHHVRVHNADEDCCDLDRR
jgi:hypothetical protein